MTRAEAEELSRELEDLRRMVEQLGELSSRVHAAADRAIQALNEGTPTSGHQ